MIRYDFTQDAEKLLLDLPKDIQQKIIGKLEYFLNSDNPLAFAKRLTGSKNPTYRFRVGDYRIVFDWEGDSIFVTKVGHRKDIYR